MHAQIRKIPISDASVRCPGSCLQSGRVEHRLRLSEYLAVNALLTRPGEEMVTFMTMQPVIRMMDESDPETISAAFTALGWHKPPTLYQRYLAEQEEGRRLAFVAEWRGSFAGYVTLLWVSAYSPFAERQVPEISDLNVLPAHCRQGIANALLDCAESAASARSNVVGLGVGLYSDYGAVQRIYVRRGYLPDGRGIMYGNQPVEPVGQLVCGGWNSPITESCFNVVRERGSHPPVNSQGLPRKVPDTRESVRSSV
jgi:GNAT superfamily N-acetyltransferase